MTTQLAHLNDTDLASRIEQSGQPLLVDFWAEWCGPCRALAPTLEELGEEFSERATITKVNVDESPGSAAKYGIQGIPTLILFKDGKEKERLVGAHPKKAIEQVLARWAA